MALSNYLAPAQLNVRVAQSTAELMQAFHLVYKGYRLCDYIPPHPSELHLRIHQLLPISQTIFASSRCEAIGSGTVVFDSEFGLPSDGTFEDTLQERRQSGRRLCEGTLLSCIDHQFGAGGEGGSVKATQVMIEIVRWVVSLAVNYEVDDFCVTVNPRHLRFWRDILGFDVRAGHRSCVVVQGAPGVLLSCDLRKVRQGQPIGTKYWREQVQDRLISKELLPGPTVLGQADILNFIRLIPGLINQLNTDQLEALRRLCPAISDRSAVSNPAADFATWSGIRL